MKPQITLEDLDKLDIRIGEIIQVAPIEDSEKLLRLTFDFGDFQRTVLAGIRKFFPDTSVLVGKKLPVLVTLAPRKMAGEESQGMILATDSDDSIVFLTPESAVKNGSSLR